MKFWFKDWLEEGFTSMADINPFSIWFNVWEHSGGGRHIDADWSPNFEDLYSPELDFRIFVWPVCFLLVS